MTSLLLIRHAQASFFGDDYDSLSDIGRRQSARLGQHLVERGLELDAVYVGPRKRHQQTAELAREAFGEAGLTWPEHRSLDAFNEFAIGRLVEHGLQQLKTADDQIRRLDEAYQGTTDPPRKLAHYQRLLEAIVRHWVDGAVVCDDVETWPQFRRRVEAGVRQIVEADRTDRRIAVFTSLGPIAAALAFVLDAPDHAAWRLSWRLRNGSITEVVCVDGAMALDGFNLLTHLDDELITFR